MSDLQKISNHLPIHLLRSICGDETYVIANRPARLLPLDFNFYFKEERILCLDAFLRMLALQTLTIGAHHEQQ